MTTSVLSLKHRWGIFPRHAKDALERAQFIEPRSNQEDGPYKGCPGWSIVITLPPGALLPDTYPQSNRLNPFWKKSDDGRTDFDDLRDEYAARIRAPIQALLGDYLAKEHDFPGESDLFYERPAIMRHPSDAARREIYFWVPNQEKCDQAMAAIGAVQDRIRETFVLR